MKKINNIKKQQYSAPIIEKIEIDKDISLQLSSSPPIGPFETNNLEPSRIENPFKNDLV